MNDAKDGLELLDENDMAAVAGGMLAPGGSASPEVIAWVESFFSKRDDADPAPPSGVTRVYTWAF